ncbi:MAG TPA: Crp/Fnr family transcriptional regulator [Cyclobacteriaceae bacterium]|nr:Crp/Fnr family transcriptional regulator [Cyclobacteriaceae bacterium]
MRSIFPGFTLEFYKTLLKTCKVVAFPPDQVILREGSYVNVIPLVLKGLLKVTRKEEDKEILLYYIGPGQSCIMSFSACISNTQSKIFAITEEDSELLLIPSGELAALMKKYPLLSNYFFSLYHDRYENLIKSIDLLVFKNFDERLLLYLKEKSRITGNPVIQTTHQEIANDMGTLREVASRTLKKLEKDNKISLTRNEIIIL